MNERLRTDGAARVRRLGLFALVGIAVELAGHALVAGLRERGIVGPVLHTLVDAGVSFAGVAAAFFWIVYRPVRRSWQAQRVELEKGEKFYRAAVDESRDMILRLTPAGEILQGNPAAQRLIDALGPKSQSSLFPDSTTPPDEVRMVRERRARLTPGAPRVAQSASVVLGGGQVRRIEWTEVGFFDRDERLAEVHVVGRDVTELAETRLRLEESEARYRTLFTGSLTALLIGDPSTATIVDANPRAVELTGYAKEELQGRSVAELFVGEAGQAVNELLKQGPGRPASSALETILQARSGGRVPVEIVTGRMADWDGRPLVLLAIRDGSRRKAEEAVRAAREAKLRALFHAAPVGIGLFRERIFVEANEGFAAILGYAPEELVGRSSRLLYPSDEAFEETGRKLYDAGLVLREGVGETTVRLVRKDGSPVDVLLVAAPFDPADPGKGVAVAVLDVTERLALEAETRKNDVLLRLYSGHAPAILWTTDALLGVTSALGAPLVEGGVESPRSDGRSIETLFGSPESAAVVRAQHRIALEAGSSSFSFERGGRLYEASVEALRGPDGTSTGILGVAVDTTDRRRAEERSRKRQGQLRFLLSLARLALSPAETSRLLRSVAEEVRQEFRVPLVAIGLLDRRKGRTILAGVAGAAARSGAGPVDSVRPRAPLGATIAGEVVKTGRRVVLSREEIAGRPVDAGLEAFGAGMVLGVPLWARGEVIGALSLASPGSFEATDEIVSWIETVADFVSLVIERRQAGDELLKLSRVVEESQVAVVVLDPIGRIEYVNPFFSDRTGFGLADVAGMDPRFLESPDHPVEPYAEARRAAEGGRQWAGELPVRIADGRVLWWSIVYSPLLDARGRITNIVTVAEDITARKAAVEELRLSREKLRALWARLAALQEEERRELARELHEGIGQTLAGLSYGISWVGRHLAPGQDAVAAELARLTAEANGAIDGVRKLTRSLRPASIDLDTVSALETEVAAFRRRTGIPCGFSADPDSLRLDADRALVVFRVLQEGLRNAVLHGDPDEVAVSLRLRDGVLRLEVTDDGRGADPDRPLPEAALGLTESSERVSAVGGVLRLERNLPRGTRLVAEIPVPSSGTEGRL